MTRHRSFVLPLIAVVVALAMTWLARPARADGQIEVFLQVKPPDPQDPKAKAAAPTIEATIVGGPNLTADKFSLIEPSAKTPIELKPLGPLRPYTAGTETIAIAIVFNGQEVWIGNDDIEPEDSAARYLGILKNLKLALQSVPFANAGPPGSKGMLIAYGDKAEVKVPMGPLANITAESFGTQKDYYKKLGSALVEGISLAVSELHNVTTSRKALIVVSDGNDTNNDAAKAQLAALKKQAAADKIQTFAIIYKGPVSEPGNVITTMIPTATTVNNAEGISTTIQTILSRMGDRYYLTFPGYDPKLKVGLAWDGKPHDLVIKIDKDETDPVTLTLAPVWQPSSGGGFPWWILIVVVVLVIIILIAAKMLKRQPEPEPVLAMAPVEPPKPAGPAKTVILGVHGNQDGYPIVGWIVPLNGNQAYQTFRLRSGGTKIGTAPPADVVINDGFMSTEHCQIHTSPSGFTLIDSGSTNGSYVNERKVQKHELVDNDTFTLGKTTFRFKSIN
ncbi:MAG: FHA domain-containing protein [Kofleriaceae bacterium]